MQLFLVFFGAPILGLRINPWVAAGVALTCTASAFLGEIWRGSHPGGAAAASCEAARRWACTTPRAWAR